ncbi:PREDICTED: immune-associated nucleotide-binding protein 9-like [Lupinus angustifolius]|uniref:immune-associated nucleotide-binding protein 9-like n=1 Tax=Lupinus angustifolius TaxID=3871 RepID=UPI00092E5011|nr:PREDICTED: immune-associated nucleotide-binding protein 9-like [Lupinus angustifolius]
MGGSSIHDDWELTSSTKEAKTMLLVGRAGNGKSATGNSILGRKVFKSKTSSSCVTNTCEFQSTELSDGQHVNVIDTPGLFDSSVGDELIVKEIVKCFDLAKDGIHAVLLVFSVGSRFTQEEVAILHRLQALFGDKIVNYMILVFTGGDVLEDDGETLDDYLGCECPQLLKITNYAYGPFSPINKVFSILVQQERQMFFEEPSFSAIIANNSYDNWSRGREIRGTTRARFNTQGTEPQTEAPEESEYVGSISVSMPTKELLTLCENRCVLFDNKTKDEKNKFEQVQLLVSLVDMVISQNGGGPFTNEIFTDLKEGAINLRDQQRKADSTKECSKGEILDYRKQMLQMQQKYDDQLERITEMVTSKLTEAMTRLEQQLAEERDARCKAEMDAKSAQRKSDEEIQKLREHLRMANEERGGNSCVIL